MRQPECITGLEDLDPPIPADELARLATNERAPQLTARMPDHELWIGFLRDPDGNLVGLLEERR